MLRRLRPSWALRSGELMVIYVMLCMASAVNSIDFIDVLVPMMTHIYWYDDPSAGRPYGQEIIPYTPRIFSVSDPDALRAWHENAPTFWTLQTLRAWGPPVALWTGVILVMLWVMLCLAALLREKWIEQERLSYPVTFLPVQIAGAGRVFRDWVFWWGYAAAAGISLLNGLSVLMPALPMIRVKMRDLSPYFSGRPWNAVGWTPISFYPFGIGLGYLLPPDLLFSTWFFYWAFKAQRVGASALGLTGYDARVPYIEQQCFGAYMYVALFGLWLGRRYFASVLEKALPWTRRGPRAEQEAGMGPRITVWGATLGIAALIAFYWLAGMSLWLAALAWLIYWALCLSVTRMRAELGPPAHDLHQGGPDFMLTSLLGTRMMGIRNLNLLTWFYWFNRAYRSLAMPHMLEGYAMARRQRFPDQAVTVAVILAGIVGTLATFVALAYFGVSLGAEAKMAGHATYFGWEAFNRLRGWIYNPTAPSPPMIGGVVAGCLIAATLHRLTIRYLWWPLHPLGFAIAGSYSVSTLWCPLLIAWIAKSLLLHYGGQRWHERGLPFFLGLLVGDYTMGCMWPTLGWILGRPMYSFQQ